MSKFKVDDKVKANVDSDLNPRLRNGEEYYIISVVDDMVSVSKERGGQNIVSCGGDADWYDYRFELVERIYPVLKPFQRVVLQDKTEGIVFNEKQIVFSDKTWLEACFNQPHDFQYLNIIEVYDVPDNPWHALDPKWKGSLLWKAEDTQKRALEDAVVKAAEAVLEASKQLDEAKEALQEYK